MLVSWPSDEVIQHESSCVSIVVQAHSDTTLERGAVNHVSCTQLFHIEEEWGDWYMHGRIFGPHIADW